MSGPASEDLFAAEGEGGEERASGLRPPLRTELSFQVSIHWAGRTAVPAEHE